MVTHYTKKMQTGEQGIAYIQYVSSKVGCIYRPFEKADIGIDGVIELINERREPSGDFILVQVKSGLSFIRGSKYYLKADKDHFETWSRYSIPVVGIIHNPQANEQDG